MLDFRIQTFLAVCRHLNYTKAAQELCITQPAVSQHIRFLEESSKKGSDGITDIIKCTFQETLVLCNIRPYPYHFYSLHPLYLLPFISISIVHFPFWKIRETCNHGYLMPRFTPFTNMLIRSGRRSIHLRRKIIRKK